MNSFGFVFSLFHIQFHSIQIVGTSALRAASTGVISSDIRELAGELTTFASTEDLPEVEGNVDLDSDSASDAGSEHSDDPDAVNTGMLQLRGVLGASAPRAAGGAGAFEFGGGGSVERVPRTGEREKAQAELEVDDVHDDVSYSTFISRWRLTVRDPTMLALLDSTQMRISSDAFLSAVPTQQYVGGVLGSAVSSVRFNPLTMIPSVMTIFRAKLAVHMGFLRDMDVATSDSALSSMLRDSSFATITRWFDKFYVLPPSGVNFTLTNLLPSLEFTAWSQRMLVNLTDDFERVRCLCSGNILSVYSFHLCGCVTLQRLSAHMQRPTVMILVLDETTGESKPCPAVVHCIVRVVNVHKREVDDIAFVQYFDYTYGVDTQHPFVPACDCVVLSDYFEIVSPEQFVSKAFLLPVMRPTSAREPKHSLRRSGEETGKVNRPRHFVLPL